MRNLNDLSTTQRVELAKKKTQRLVDLTIDLIARHEINRIVVYSPRLATQIPQSFAAHAFNSFQDSLYSFGLVRLCALWGKPRSNDFEMESIPAVVDLIEPAAVLDSLQREAYLQHSNPIPIIGLQDEPPEIRAAIEQEERASTESWARQQSEKFRRQLETAIQRTRRISSSTRLESIVNHRDKHLAHSLAETQREKRGPVQALKYGYERDLIWKTVAIVDRLHLGINGAGFSWKESVRIARKNAEALWYGCTFKVLE